MSKIIYKGKKKDMKNYDIALFDLDGTLSESGEGIIDCVKKVFEEMERPLPDEESLSKFIGPPMYESLKRCGFNAEDAEKGVEIYKRNFVKSGIYKNRVYDGMFDVLKALKSKGIRLGVATTKYQKFADKIIDMLKLDEYFDVIGGSTSLTGTSGNLEKPRHDKADVMNYVIDTLRQSSDDKVVMIGDTKFDADGAEKIGCDFIGCLYGYGTLEEMKKICPEAVFVNEPSEIISAVIPEKQ